MWMKKVACFLREHKIIDYHKCTASLFCPLMKQPEFEPMFKIGYKQENINWCNAHARAHDISKGEVLAEALVVLMSYLPPKS